MPNSASPGSPGPAGQEPGRPSILPPTGSENSAKNEFHREIYREKSNSREYVNPPADGGNANLAVARGDVTSGLPPATSSNGAARALRNWADCPEDQGPGADDDFTVVRTKKRRRESANSPTAAAPSSNIGGARTSRRPQSSAGSVPRAQEIRTTRAHITEARARQASSSEDHCVYLEHGPELQPFHYLRALDRMLGGTAGVIQVSKVNGHQLLGLANRGLAERLINEGLEVEGTLLRAFPFRKRAERITVGNLPFFVEDSAIISALKPYGRVTSIAPKLMKAGPYTYNDGRREAFIVLREGMTTERLPTRLEIPIKGEAWPAYLSSGIKCSRCHGQGHRRANCPLLAGRTNAPRPATPISPTSVPPVTAPGLPRQPSAHPPPPASPSPAMETPSASPAARAVTPSAAPRPSTPVAPAVPVEMAPPAPPPVTPAPSLRAPGGSVSPQSTKSGPPAQDIEMTAIEESSASSTSSSRTSMRDDLVAFIQRSPTVSFTGTDALGLGREEVLDLLSSRTKAQRKRGLLAPPQTDALAGLIEQILGLKPAGNTNVYKILHQVKSELKKGPAAVPPTPPLPAPRPAGPTPPVPHGVETKPAMATPPPPLPTPMEEEHVDHEDLMEDLFDELNSDTELKPLLDSGFSTKMEKLTYPEIEKFTKLLRLISQKVDVLGENLDSRLSRLEHIRNVADVPGATPLSFRIADNSPQLETTERFSKIKPPTYDGQTSWKCFKTQFEVVALGNRWNSSEKAINLAASLRGSATEVLQSLPLEQSLDYERLIHALTLRFGDDILQPYHVVKLKNRRQKRDETLQELAADVERLARLAFPDCPRHVQDLLAHQNFVDAIEDPECQQSVRMSEAKTLQEALIHALKFEAARDATRGYQKVVRVVKTDESQKDGDIKEAISQLQRTVEEMKKSMSFSESAPGTYRQRTYRPNAKTICWNCGKPGHIRANCRVRQAPSERGNTGPGLAVRCDDASEKIIRVSSLQGGSNELATEGLVNGLPCRMIGNNLFSHLGYLADIKDDCLIGLDVLRKFGFSIDFQENVLKIAGEEIPLVCSRSSATNKVLKVILKSDVKIPPRSECILEGRLTASLGVPQLLIVEENGQEFGQKGLLLARTLCKSDQSNIPIRVVNLLDSAKTLGKGTEIAIAEPVTNVAHCTTVENLDKSPCSSLIPGHLQELLEGTREGLNWIQQKKLEHLLCQYEDVFATSPKDVGRTNVTQHRIDTGGATPVKQLPRRLPMTRRDEVAKLIEEMAEQDVIEPSSSPWASPVVLVKKKDGSTRFCVDYRRLNDLTKKDSYPLPRIDATLDTLSGSQWFSTLDLKSGYWQVSIHPEDREKTAFTTGNGLWQFKVMPFGLCNAPATFERLMETVLQGIPLETCLVYLDDIIVMGKSFEEHLINLERVLQKIRGARLKLNPRKCKPFKEKVRYLGHVISRQGIQTDPDRTETVRQWPVPRDVHQLRSFLGLCSYYRRFVPGFSNIARPLHRLTESGRPFSWTIDCERAMDKLKQALSSPPMLAYPDPGEPFILDTDASNTGIGAVLSQTQDGVERVIAYFSKTLSKPERNYCVTRRELLAIVKSTEHFYHYLYGQKFLLRTDHAALRWLLNFKSPEGQLARWIQRLQEYDMEIQHRKGKSHGNADALSRRPCPVNCKHCSKAETQAELNIRQLSLAEELKLDEWSPEEMRKSQFEDADLRPVMNWLNAGTNRPAWEDVASCISITKSYWSLWDSLEFRGGVLYRKWESDDGQHIEWKMILPQSRVPSVLKELHNSPSGGHFGIAKTLGKVKERFYWLAAVPVLKN
ncbi:K02A2.6-like, partial [Cordylochernes scorpioides]